MNDYIFRMPAGTPDLTFAGLAARLREVCDLPRCKACCLAIGTTVRVSRAGGRRDALDFSLYGTVIARISMGTVYFPETGDAHLATTEWLSRIVHDNGIGSRVWRIRRHAADGPGAPVARGYAGLLVIDGDRARPAEGYRYAAGQPGREPWCTHDAAAVHPVTLLCECGEPAPARTRHELSRLATATRR